jgi:hypothetical protein
MLTGQAAGTIAAISIKRGVQPRYLDPLSVQLILLEDGATLIQRWHNDVRWGSELWQAAQILSLYKIMDRSGPMGTCTGMGFTAPQAWDANKELTVDKVISALKKLAKVCGYEVGIVNIDEKKVVSNTVIDIADSVNPKLSRQFKAVKYPLDEKPMTDGLFAIWCLRVLKRVFQ